MTGAKILLVDDEASIRETVERFLSLTGYTVTAAAGGAEALEACKQNDFALVLTDLKMPGMSGEELLYRIQEVSPTTEIIIMTGYPTVETAIRTLKAGACDYLLKPFELADLEKVVQHTLERQRSARTQDKPLRSPQAGDAGLPVMHSTPFRLSQILALKFTPQGEIKLTARRKDRGSRSQLAAPDAKKGKDRET